MKQRGFLTLYLALGALAVIVVMGIAIKVQTSRLEAANTKYEVFVAQTKALGEIAEKKAKEKEAIDIKRKQEADRENVTNRARIADLSKRLRDERSRSGILPPAPSGSPSSQTAAFDRTLLERALQQLDESISGLIGEGDQAITDLNTAKTWAK